jgi:hypothetical protein
VASRALTKRLSTDLLPLILVCREVREGFVQTESRTRWSAGERLSAKKSTQFGDQAIDGDRPAAELRPCG